MDNEISTVEKIGLAKGVIFVTKGILMKRGRPKGRSRDNRSFGPLGDLIRKKRLEKELGLLDVARACDCSVQFISNIEHGRAPLPWDKLESLSKCLGIPLADLQSANFAIRSDFKSFMKSGGVKSIKGKRVPTPAILAGVAGAASAVSAKAPGMSDEALAQIIQAYETASSASKKKFVKTALKLLAE